MTSVIGVLLVLIYLGGGWKFWSGFNRTNFSQNKFILTILWPVLLMNKPYRENFSKALKG